MTYRGSLPPPGQGYNGQQQMASGGYNMYANGMPYQNAQYQHANLVPQQEQVRQMQGYVDVDNTAQYAGYGGSYGQQVSANRMQYNVQQQLPPQHVATTAAMFQPMPPPLPIEHPHVSQQPSFQPLQSPGLKSSPAKFDPPRRGSDLPPVKTPKKEHRRPTPGYSPISKSPSLSSVQSLEPDTPSLLVCVAEDCFEKAHAAVQDVASRLDKPSVEEYHKLIATGLGCLEAAMQTGKLSARVEAKVRLRYAAILIDETENLMEAETALTKGTSICEMHRFADLKYCMQYLLLKVLFRRNWKAALIATDKYISDCMSSRQVHWVYAFRFLRAAFNLRSGHLADSHAIDNLRQIITIADQRGDKAISVLTSLLEGLALLKTGGDEMRVQECIARASKHQQDPSVHLPQIDVLAHLLDLACSLQEKNPTTIFEKIKTLQLKMDEALQDPKWEQNSKELLLPLQKQPNTTTSISQDTRSILMPAAGTHEHLVLSWMSKPQAFILAHVFSGLASQYKSLSGDKSLGFWNEALKLLRKLSQQKQQHEMSLQEAMEEADWRAGVSRYIYILMGLHSASQADWPKVNDCVQKLENGLVNQPPKNPLDIIAFYLSGVLQQGTANLAAALHIFEDPVFEIRDSEAGPNEKTPSDVALLAALNRLWIMQEPRQRNEWKIAETVEKVRRFCENHPDRDLRTAYNLTMATIQTNPPLLMQQVKQHIQASLSGSQATNNTHYLSIALNIMRCRLFDNVVGEQALKSAKAGAAQAKKSGNLLWMSVADGMLSQSYEMQGDMAQARATRESGTRFANEALAKTKV
ncbi:Cohesin loading factor [Pleurostoma richardsiae]|uniref:Cohesin loading factor n=1 Tax=Pleurostoma richardsiae TaxID=41990 RepID=A0AA38S309_9PEZI|nr:Cohesin loading factor [Pleurostoma richardsiae]